MADNTYITSGNNAALASLIKDYALFLFKNGETYTFPISASWTPPTGKRPVGYNSEDGSTLHPEPGDTNEIKGHNGDIVVSETDPGYWTVQFTGIECRKSIAEAYFGVEADKDGAFHVKDATTPLSYGVVLAGLDQHGNPIVLGAANAKVSDRDDMTFKSSDTISFNLTMRFFKAADGFQFHVFGLLAAETAATTPAGA